MVLVEPLNGQPGIIATSQQTRFDPTEASEIDLKQVNIAVGDRELLADAALKLKAGVRYAFVGRWVIPSPYLLIDANERARNGSGKSSMSFVLY